jgi:hypothetical protein
MIITAERGAQRHGTAIIINRHHFLTAASIEHDAITMLITTRHVLAIAAHCQSQDPSPPGRALLSPTEREVSRLQHLNSAAGIPQINRIKRLANGSTSHSVLHSIHYVNAFPKLIPNPERRIIGGR